MTLGCGGFSEEMSYIPTLQWSGPVPRSMMAMEDSPRCLEAIHSAMGCACWLDEEPAPGSVKPEVHRQISSEKLCDSATAKAELPQVLSIS